MRETGIPGILLMERAAEAVAGALSTLSGGGALFLCGSGNNGGDGYAAARLLHGMGRPARIWSLCDPDALKGDARTNMLRCRALGIPIEWKQSFEEALPLDCDRIVDALLGTGLLGPLSGIYAEAVRWINASGLPVLAVDMPSGTGEQMVRADVTVTFHRMKPCHLLFPGRARSGRIVVADIGLPDDPYPDDFELLEDVDIKRLLPPRPVDAHKGDCGHVLALAGAQGMAGAAALCAMGALRGGAGLVTVLCPAGIVPIVQTLAPCAICTTPERVGEALSGKDSIAAGPGLGASPQVSPLLELLCETDLPQVWDADALNWLAANPRKLPGRSVITPHPGEAARLLGATTQDVLEDPVAAAAQLAGTYGAAALLKGATTVIADGPRRALDISGTPGMATGGSGDVLTGLIAALLAQGLGPFDAARLGALLHGRAGERAAASRGLRSMIATDILDALRIG